MVKQKANLRLRHFSPRLFSATGEMSWKISHMYNSDTHGHTLACIVCAYTFVKKKKKKRYAYAHRAAATLSEMLCVTAVTGWWVRG